MENRKSITEGACDNNMVPYLVFSDSIRTLEGKALTLIDASVADVIQRQAVKDILRQQIWMWAADSDRSRNFDIYHKEGSIELESN